MITNWGFGGVWSSGTPPASGQGDINITNVFLQDTTITNASNSGSLNYLRIISGNGISGTSNINVITSGGLFSRYGLRLGSKATLTIANTSTFGNNENQSFDLSGGRLILSNGASVFLNFNAASQNDGTIQFVAGSGQQSDLNYAQNGGRFLNNSVVIKDGSGTGSFVGNFGGNNFSFINAGSITVNGGTMVVNTASATTSAGFSNTVSGTITVNSGATFVIARASGGGVGWSANDSENVGTIVLNGGTITTFDNGAQSTTRTVRNTGTVIGNGNFAAGLFNPQSSSRVIADGGTLTFSGAVYGSGGGATWIATNVGAQANTLNFTVSANLEGATLNNSNGMVRLSGGPVLNLPNTFRQNWGTLNFAGNGQIIITNAGGSVFTNQLTIVRTGSGTGTLTLGSGSGGNNYGFVNNGTVTAGGGGITAIDTANAFTLGLSNSVSGRIEVGTGGGSANSQFVYNRTSGAWSGGDTPVNLGTVTFLATGGTFSLSADGTTDATRQLSNSGSIIASITGGTPGTWTFNGSLLNTANGSLVVSNGTFSNVRFTGGNSGWVRLDSANAQLNLGNSTFTNSGTVNLQGGTFSYANVANGAMLWNQSSGVITGSGTLLLGFGSGNENYSLYNAGTIVAAGGALSINSSNAFTGSGLSNVVGGVVRVDSGAEMRVVRTDAAWTASDVRSAVFNAGTLQLNGGSFTLVDSSGTGSGRFIRNLGTISGFGTLSGSVTNFGTIMATNGTLIVNSTGRFSQGGTLAIEQSGTLLLTNTTALSGQTFSNAGAILMRGGTLLAGTITNAGQIAGLGTIEGGGVFNGGTLLASNLTANVGTFTVRLTSFTNANGATIGTIGTQAVLNVRTPGSVNVLINEGTINISGGTITFNDGAAGTITNYNTIGGVGNLASFPVVNVGNSSLIAQNPIPGLNTLIATVGITNSGLLAARQSATLDLTVSSGTTIVNTNRLWLEGSTITLHNGAGIITNVNNGLIVGWGTLNASVVNLNSGVILATNTSLLVGLHQNANAGLLTNLNATSALRLTNSILVNTGRIALNSGGLYLTGSTITNQGTITGPGDSPSSLVNDTTGFVLATNGTLHIATNAAEFVENRGTIQIVSGGTLNVGPAVWNNVAGGLITNASGGVVTRSAGVGLVTNAGVIANAGTFDLQVHNLGNITNAGGRFTQSLTNATGGQIISAGGTFSGATFANLGGTVVATNSPVTLLHTSVLNTGTMIGSPTAPLIITNLTANMANAGTLIANGAGTGDSAASFYILRVSGGSGDFTNSVGGTIAGAGYFRTGDFVGGGRNFTIWNQGSLLATNGQLILQPADAFANGGFVNLGGTVTVANAAGLAIQRTDNAWSSSGTTPRNEGLILLNGGTLVFYGDSLSIANDRALTNAPTGTIRGSGTLITSLNNQGTVIATNGTLFLNNTAATTQGGTITIADGGTFTVLGSAGSFQNNGRILFTGGTFVGTNFASFRNTGTISGQGTLQTGRASGSGGANQEIINTGTIVASGGTLYIQPGDAFSAGGFSNAVGGVVRVESAATLILNRTANAWGGSANPQNLGTLDMGGGTFILRSSNNGGTGNGLAKFIDNRGLITGSGTISGNVTNFGTVAATNGVLTLSGEGRFRQAGTLDVQSGGTLVLTNPTTAAGVTFTNEAVILMRGGELQSGTIINTNSIAGWGTITGEVRNDAQVFGSNGTLWVAFDRFTNVSTATIGTRTTNAVLDAQIPNGGTLQPFINQGTISMGGGTLLFNGFGGGVISNRSSGVIVGVGHAMQTVVNSGTILAANPVSGLSMFSVGLSEINSGTIGASNNAILNVVISGGAATACRNEGSISMIGGSLVISNGAFGIITNAGTVSGVGTVTPSIHNLSNILATVAGGTLDVRLLGGTNTASGQLRAGSGATLQVQDNLINFGTIGAVGANGGTIQMAAASNVITNRGVITGDAAAASTLAINNFVFNESDGTIIATNGTVTFNATNGLANVGSINVENSGTFQSNSSNSWVNAGNINMRGGTLRSGGFTNAATSAIWTNSGTITGYGTIIGGGAYGGSGAGFDKSVANLGTILVTNPLSGAAATLTISTGGATAEDGIRNSGNMIISSNNTLVLSRQAGLPILNTGTITIHNGNLTGSGVLSNTTSGVIQGYGTLTHDIVNLAGGLIHATNGLMTMTSSVFPVNQGTFMISGGATMTWNTSNSWFNAGTVDMRGGTLRTGGFTNPAVTAVFTNSGVIKGWGTVFGGGAFNTNGIGIDKSFVNLNYVVASNGVLTIDTGVSVTNRGLANLGTMVVQGATDTLALLRQAEVSGSPFFVTNLNYLYNSGRIFINGGTLTANTAITNQFESASLPGLIQGYGRIAFTNEIVNVGTIRSTNGVLQFINSQIGDTDIVEIRQSGTLVVESGSEMIVGTATNSVLVNNGTIVMNGGIFRSSNLTNSVGANFRGYGTITSPIINFGTGLATSASVPLHLTGAKVENRVGGVLGASNGILIVDAVFTNAGTVMFRNSLGTFNSAVVNQGAWTMNPSTNVYFGDYTVTSNGYLTMAASSVNIFKSNFFNQSYMSNDYNTLNGTFVFDGEGGHTQSLYVAGINLGGWNSSLQPSNEVYFTHLGGTYSTNSFTFFRSDPIYGFTNNFALGSLEIGSLNTTSTLALIDTRGTIEPTDNRKAGLYVHSFNIAPGSLLIVSNNVEFYFMTSNGVSGVSLGALNPGDNVLILDGGSFHQLVVIPEPSVLFLLTIGVSALVWYRRRRN